MNKWTRRFEWSRASAEPAGTERIGHHYFAFLSYSHADSADADWLHQELERFRVPSGLAGKLTRSGVVPKRLTPIFRDRHELAASDDLGAEIREALELSRCLIVLCSPAAAKSKWTNAEIETFKRLHPEGCIVAAVIAGEPLASDIPGREDEECFPPALVAKYNRRGKPTGKKTEPLAADLRVGKGGRRLGFLKIVAGILGVGLDDLVQRETLRRQRRLAWLAAASLAGMAVTSTLAVTAIQARDEAREQRRQAEGIVGFMLGDLKDKLEPIGRLDALDAVGSRALDYYQAQDKSTLTDESLAQRSRALTLMGQIAQTRGDLAGALKRYEEALASTGEIVRRYPDDPEKLWDHAQNVFWVGYIAQQRGQTQQALQRFNQYRELAQQMVTLGPEKSKYRLEVVYANNSLGAVLMDERRYLDAAQVFRASVSAGESLAAGDPRNADYRKQLVGALSWLADSNEYSGALDESLAEHEREVQLLNELKRENPGDTEVDRFAMTAHRTTGRLLASKGDSAGALKELRHSVEISDALFRIEPENTEWLQANAAGRYDLARLQLAMGDVAGAASTARSGCDIADRLLQRDSSVADWKAQLRVRCLTMRARIAIATGANAEAVELSRQAVRAAQSTPRPIEQRMLTFHARAIGGNALSALGRNAEAASWWQAAVKSLPNSIQLRPTEMEQLAAVESRLGDRGAAARLTSKLAAMGYRYPGSGRVV